MKILRVGVILGARNASALALGQGMVEVVVPDVLMRSMTRGSAVKTGIA